MVGSNTDGRSQSKPVPVLSTREADVYYGSFYAVRRVSLDIAPRQVTAFIGPSGCGKSTILRCFNRMNDLILGARVGGQVLYHNFDIYGPDVDAVELRRRIGIVFQRPNPFPKTIYENIAYGPRIAGFKGDMDELVERTLRQAALWDEVKDKLKQPGTSLSGGQQQRLCIARTLAVEPEVILMDEPCSALDPISTLRIEELIKELKQKYTIVIVTHNMQQAARVSDMVAFYNAELDEKGVRFGRLVEYDYTTKIFNAPSQRETEEYVSGRFG